MIEEMMINSFGPGLVPPLFTIMIGQKIKKTNFKKKSFWSLGGGGGASTT